MGLKQARAYTGKLLPQRGLIIIKPNLTNSSPPVATSVAVDTLGSKCLGHNPKKLSYLTLANGLLGTMDNIEIVDH